MPTSAADGTIDFRNGGYRPAARHADLYKGEHFPRRPGRHRAVGGRSRSRLWTERRMSRARISASRKLLDGMQAGTEEEI